MNKFLCVPVILFWLFAYVQGAPLQRIVGGHDPPPHYGRFHVSLQNLTGYHVCGGAVVSDRHIITAAHCVNGAEPQYIKAVVGTTNLAVGGHEYDIKSVLIHDEYSVELRKNDIAILEIIGIFDSQHVDILKLYRKEILEGDPLTLSGFGAQEPHGVSSDQMYALNLTVFSQETCRFAMRYNREVFDEMFCTFIQLGQGTCHGDSGSPILKDGQLAGVVSWGIPCAVGFPDVHTRISPYIFWIFEEMGKSNECYRRQ